MGVVKSYFEKQKNPAERRGFFKKHLFSRVFPLDDEVSDRHSRVELRTFAQKFLAVAC
jgi:hypothetical protein